MTSNLTAGMDQQVANMAALRAARASLQQELFDALRADGSEHAIGADGDMWVHV